jgi:hypothetical protein
LEVVEVDFVTFLPRTGAGAGAGAGDEFAVELEVELDVGLGELAELGEAAALILLNF